MTFEFKLIAMVMTAISPLLFTANAESFGTRRPAIVLNPQPVLETPQSYTLDQALKIALQKNFNSRIEFEHAIQARLTAKSAYLELLPHFSVGGLISVASGGVFGILGALGDFAPFLFPSRWIQAKEAKDQSIVEQDTVALMRADLMPQVEGLVYTSLEDEASITLYQQIIADTNQVYLNVLNLESKGQMPVGSANQLLSTLQGFQMDEQTAELLVKKDHEAISQALGFMNPAAVSGVSLGFESNTVEAATPLDAELLVPTVMNRSLELRQNSDLTEVARLQKEEIAFDWFDPSYDSGRDLGFGLGAQIKISSSVLNELTLFAQQMQQTLEMSTDDAVEDYNLAIEQFPEAQAHFNLQKQRWVTVISQVFPGTALNTLDIQSILDDFVVAGLNLEMVRASFRTARARVDRLLLQNNYVASQFQAVQP